MAFVHGLLNYWDKGRTLTCGESLSLEIIFARNSKGVRRDRNKKFDEEAPAGLQFEHHVDASCRSHSTQRLFQLHRSNIDDHICAC